MKKILVLLFVCALMAFQQASAQQLKFYYYPKANIYYDLAGHQYIYLNNGTWTTVSALPSGIAATGRKVVVRYSGQEVWRVNAMHQKKYLVTTPRGEATGYKRANPNRNVTHTPRGKAVGYKGTNPNKAKGKKY